jgi:hypothetical protein
LLDQLEVSPENNVLTSKIKIIFETNLSHFVTRLKPNVPLVELNKQFLSQVLLAVNKLFSNLKQEQQIKRINIGDEDVTGPYKVEEIHAARQNDFEQQVSQRRMEFESAIIPQKPKALDFSDKTEEGKIKEMESLIAETVAKRNFDIEIIQNSFNTNAIDPESWLKPAETSIKTEKQGFQVTTNKFVPDLSNKSKKNVSWDEPLNDVSTDNIQLTIVEKKDPTDNNIFAKLKKKPVVDEPIASNSNNNQLIEQMTELNKKMDKLIELFMKNEVKEA